MRTALIALALLAAGCTLTPDVSAYQPKAAADCPGQKACGYRCVDADDPAAGCGLATCSPCPAGGANTVPVCGAAQACAVACAPGFAAADGDPAHGCGVPVLTDASSCGAVGHACPAGVSCSGGTCQQAPSTEVAATGEAPRGLAVLGSTFYWAVDPPVVGGGSLPTGALLTADRGGASTPLVTNMGHPTLVRSQPGPLVAVLGTDPFDDTTGNAVLVQAPPALPVDGYYGGTADGVYQACGGGGQAAVGLAIAPNLLACASSEPQDGGFGYQFDYTYHPPYPSTGGGTISGFDHPLHALGTGGVIHVPAGADTSLDPPLGPYDAPLLWLGETNLIYRLADDGTSSDYSVVTGGGIYFDHLLRKPVAARIAAIPTPDLDGIYAVYFVDPTDGSLWKGRTTGPADSATPATPWRLVRGDGRARTAMDLAADDLGVVWSDLEAGEIWAADLHDQVHRLASGVHPWAIALTAERVYFTDVEARAIRSVAR